MTIKTTIGALSLAAALAYDVYSDSLTDAQALKALVDAFVAAPNEAKLSAAKREWKASRESYGQSEIYRLSGGPIDSEVPWVEASYGAGEGQLNAWPLDENMTDYTTDANGSTTTENIIAKTGMFTPSGDEPTAVDFTTINEDTITKLNENGGDANVATCYHAVEFLLWGQNQDYSGGNDTITTAAKVEGERPLTDFTTAVRNAWNKTVSENDGII